MARSSRNGRSKNFAQNKNNKQKSPRVRHKLLRSNLEETKHRANEWVQGKPNSQFQKIFIKTNEPWLDRICLIKRIWNSETTLRQFISLMPK